MAETEVDIEKVLGFVFLIIVLVIAFIGVGFMTTAFSDLVEDTTTNAMYWIGLISILLVTIILGATGKVQVKNLIRGIGALGMGAIGSILVNMTFPYMIILLSDSFSIMIAYFAALLIEIVCTAIIPVFVLTRET